VLKYAVALAKRCDARIIVVHVVEPLNPTTRSVVDHIWKEGTVDRIRDEGIKRLNANIEDRLRGFFAASAGADASEATRVSDILVEEGFPAAQIITQAERLNADVVVMGTHEHSLVGQLLGSVAHKVLHGSPIPVFLVPLRETDSSPATA
jgi:nucleotide-binding universal stress UspA family protein